MNHAIVVASDYRGIPGYPALPSAQQSRVALASRLARSDIGFQCEQFDPQPGITQRIHDYLQSKADPEGVALLYFAGHLVLTAEGEAAFLLEADQVCSVPFSRVLRALYGSFGGVMLVVDTMLACAVPNVDPQRAPQFVIDAIGPYLQQYGFGGVFAARPWGQDQATTPTPLAQLLVRACDRAAGQPTSADRLVQSIQNDTELFRQTGAFNAVLPHPDFYVLPGRQVAAQPAIITGALPTMPPPPPPVAPSILPPTDYRAHATGQSLGLAPLPPLPSIQSSASPSSAAEDEAPTAVGHAKPTPPPPRLSSSVPPPTAGRVSSVPPPIRATPGSLPPASPPRATPSSVPAAMPPRATPGALPAAMPPRATPGALPAAMPPRATPGSLPRFSPPPPRGATPGPLPAVSLPGSRGPTPGPIPAARAPNLTPGALGRLSPPPPRGSTPNAVPRLTPPPPRGATPGPLPAVVPSAAATGFDDATDVASPHPAERPAAVEAAPLEASPGSDFDQQVGEPPKFDDLFPSAEAALAAGRWAEATTSFRQCVDLALDSGQRIEALLGYGNALREQERLGEAVKAYAQVLELAPDRADALERIALMLEMQGALEQAAEHYERWLQVAPDSAGEIYRRLSQLWLLRAGNQKHAEQVLQRWLNLEPGSLEALKQLLELQQGQSRFAEAVETAKRCAEATYYSHERAEFLLAAAGLARDELEDPQGAVNLAEQALLASPASVEALRFVSSALAQSGQWERMAALYEKVLAQGNAGPSAGKIATALGKLCLSKLNDRRRAIDAFEKALLTDPTQVRLHHEVAGLYELEEDIASAGRHYRAAVVHGPLNPEAYRRACAFFAWTREFDRAYHAAGALVHFGHAEARETELHAKYVNEGLLKVQQNLTQEIWDQGLLFPERDRNVSQLLRIAYKPARERRLPSARKQKKLIESLSLQEAAQSTTTLARTFLWCTHVIGMFPPELYLSEEPGAVAMAHTDKAAVIASKALGSGLSLPDLVFLWARGLGQLRPENALYPWYPTAEDIETVLQALCFATDQGTDASGPAKKLGKIFKKTLEPEQLRDAAGLCASLPKDEIPGLALDWVRSVEQSCARLGMLCSGDSARAADLTRRFPLAGTLKVEEQIGDLLQYSITEEYGQLRQLLGINV